MRSTLTAPQLSSAFKRPRVQMTPHSSGYLIKASKGMNTLPVELLVQPLDLGISENIVGTVQPFLHCGMLVCKLWQSVIFNTPSLWDVIQFTKSPMSALGMVDVSSVERVLRKSRQLPLDIRIRSGYYDHPGACIGDVLAMYDTVIATLLSVAPRWKIATVDGDILRCIKEGPYHFSDLQSPLLEHLQITDGFSWITPSDQTQNPLSPLFFVAPKLKSVSMDLVSQPHLVTAFQNVLNWDNVSVFEGGYEPFRWYETLRGLCSIAPHIQSLSLVGDADALGDPWIKDVIEVPEWELCPSSKLLDIHFPNLESLDLKDVELPFFFRHLPPIPSLTSLTLRNTPGQTPPMSLPVTDLKKILCGCQLRALMLENIVVPDELEFVTSLLDQQKHMDSLSIIEYSSPRSQTPFSNIFLMQFHSWAFLPRLKRFLVRGFWEEEKYSDDWVSICEVRKFERVGVEMRRK